MGRLGTENTVITKTTNAIIILPKDHHVVVRMEKNLDIEKRRSIFFVLSVQNLYRYVFKTCVRTPDRTS